MSTSVGQDLQLVTAAKVLAFCEEHYIAKGDHKFSIKGREWVYEELIKPLFSWRYWPKNKTQLCLECRNKAGQLTEWSPELVRNLASHLAEGCAGLTLIPIMVEVLNLQRGAGKTCNVAAVILALLALAESMSVSFVASAGKQSRQLMREYFLDPIARNPKLDRRFRSIGDQIRFERPHGKTSIFELTDTSHKSITGRRRDLVFVDEGRDIEARTFAAIIPSVKARSRYRCPHGHGSVPYVEDSVLSCAVCNAEMWPWLPRIVVTSTSGVIESNEYDWFNELVESLEIGATPYAHLYRDDDAPNPAVAATETSMLESVFGGVKSLTTYLDVELRNTPRRKGEDFVSVAQVNAIVDRRLTNQVSSERPCYGYLDTSRVAELTSLVLVAADEERSTPNNPWGFVRLEHLKIWNPKDILDCPLGRIERHIVEGYLDRVLPMFPGLIELHVDIRGGMHWAMDMLADARKAKIGSWQKRLREHTCTATFERDTAWSIMEDRIGSGTLRIFANPTIEAELAGVRRHIRTDGSVEVRDRNRKIRHADIVEGIAQTLLRIYRHMAKPRISMAELNVGPVGEALRKLMPPAMARGKMITGMIEERDF